MNIHNALTLPIYPQASAAAQDPCGEGVHDFGELSLWPQPGIYALPLLLSFAQPLQHFVAKVVCRGSVERREKRTWCVLETQGAVQ